MKKQTLLLSLFLGIIYLTLSSNQTGPAHNGNGERTGRPAAASTTCATATSCHKKYTADNAGTTTCKIELRRKDLGTGSTPVMTYIPGQTYIVTISGSNTTSLPKFGFQFTAISGSTSIGTFGNFPANVGQQTVSAVTLVEHTTPLNGTSGNYTASFEWTAPSTASGAIVFWGILNAVDGNGSYNHDAPSPTTSLTLQATTSVESVIAENNATAYPNPFTNELNIKIGNAPAGSYTIHVFGQHGEKIITQQLDITSGTNGMALHTDSWPSGYYIIQITSGIYSEMIPIAKR